MYRGTFVAVLLGVLHVLLAHTCGCMQARAPIKTIVRVIVKRKIVDGAGNTIVETVLSNTSQGLVPRIPKIFHQIWFDFGKGNGRSVPPLYQKFTADLMDLHPGWELMLWDEERVEELLRTSYPAFLSTWLSYDVPVKRHDSARVFILHHLGGVYLDHDFMPIRNIEPLIGDHQLIFGRVDGTSNLVYNGFMAAARDNVFLKILSIRLADPQTALLFVTSATGPEFVSLHLSEYLKHLPQDSTEVRLYESEYFFPVHWTKPRRMSKEEVEREFPKCHLFQFYDYGWKEE